MKITRLLLCSIAALLCYSRAAADTTITSTAMGISAYLPDNWVAVTAGDTGITFQDTTFVYRSQITCKKHAITADDYASATGWTRAHFIAYLLVAQYSYDPFGAVLYFDSSAACMQDSLWAPEAFTEFYTIDTVLGAWNEYMRYTEAGSNGYEIYAIGDTADMKQNIGMYMGMIRMIDIDKSANMMSPVRRNFPRNSFMIEKTASSSGIFDLLGKKRGATGNLLNGIYYRPETRRLRLTVR
ncbi:MAG: hypothetical protein JW913_09640 [Chitinispirillaceae bacterium]|nr:hypothetical protein [Chitinispirillaceae bacterium]